MLSENHSACIVNQAVAKMSLSTL